MTERATYTGPGWYRIRDSAPVGAPLTTRAVYIAPLPEDPEWPMPRPWLGVWLTETDARFDSVAIIRGEPDFITGLIIERISDSEGAAA